MLISLKNSMHDEHVLRSCERVQDYSNLAAVWPHDDDCRMRSTKVPNRVPLQAINTMTEHDYDFFARLDEVQRMKVRL